MNAEQRQRRAEIHWQGWFEGERGKRWLASTVANALHNLVWDGRNTRSHRELLEDSNPIAGTNGPNPETGSFEYLDVYGHRYRITVECVEPGEYDMHNLLVGKTLLEDPRPAGKAMADEHMRLEAIYQERVREG